MSRSHRRALRTLLLVMATAVSVGACTESFEGGGACPALCPSQAEAFRDTTFEAVVLDSTLGDYPSLGLSSTLLLANRPDTLVTRGVFRFDALVRVFAPNRGNTVDSITAIDSVWLRLPLDPTGRRGRARVTLEAFDVDTTESDSVRAVVGSLFRPDRLLGSVSFIPDSTGDSLRVPLSATKVVAKIRASARLRIGVRLSSPGQLRIVAFQLGAGAPIVQYDPSTDTTYAPLTVSTSTVIANATTDITLAYQAYGIVDRGSTVPERGTLVVGGFPAYRSYLRFNLPTRITDSSTIVRAELLLTQHPSRFTNARDTVAIVPLVPTTTDAVSDLRRILDLSAEGTFARVDTARLVPGDSGVRTINVLALARTWPSLPISVPRALAFRISLEGAQPAELRFFSSEAPAGLRPRLRITYLPRAEFALP